MSFGRLERSAAARPMSEINMTPLIDVMLVLLVIFIVTAPLLASSLRLDLPRTDAAAAGEAGAVFALALDAQGRMFIGEVAADEATVRERAAALARANPATEVQLRADRAVPYGRVAELIGWMQAAGLTRIGFVTEAAPGAVPAGTASPASGPR